MPAFVWNFKTCNFFFSCTLLWNVDRRLTKIWHFENASVLDRDRIRQATTIKTKKKKILCISGISICFTEWKDGGRGVVQKEAVYLRMKRPGISLIDPPVTWYHLFKCLLRKRDVTYISSFFSLSSNEIWRESQLFILFKKKSSRFIFFSSTWPRDSTLP